VTDLPSGKKEKENGPPPTMVPLSGTKLKAYIMQVPFDAEDKRRAAFYALVSRSGDAWTLVAPDCATTREIVLGAGGIMDGAAPNQPVLVPAENVSFEDLQDLPKRHRRGRHKTVMHATGKDVADIQPTEEAKNRYGSQTCHFPTRESLEAAARRYIAERQLIGDKIVRIGD
jgi:hypothetical protein